MPLVEPVLRCQFWVRFPKASLANYGCKFSNSWFPRICRCWKECRNNELWQISDLHVSHRSPTPHTSLRDTSNRGILFLYFICILVYSSDMLGLNNITWNPHHCILSHVPANNKLNGNSFSNSITQVTDCLSFKCDWLLYTPNENSTKWNHWYTGGRHSFLYMKVFRR